MTDVIAAETPRGAGAGEHFDVVVIGAGVGGLCAAAKLAAGGARALVVEREPRVGGRASTEEIEGFRLPTGGVALELGGPMERLAREVGAGYDVREPSPGVIVRVGGRSIDTTNRAMRTVVDGVVLRAGRRLTRNWPPPAPLATATAEPTLEAALARVTRNGTVHRLARNFAAGLFGLNADEVPARAVATYLFQKGAFRRYGYCPRGSIGVMEDLAAVVARHGGAVWTGADAERIVVRAGRAHAVTIARGEVSRTVACDAVVSNAGPAATVRMLGADTLPAGYVEEVRARDLPTPMIVVDIGSRAPLLDEAGIVFFGDTTRLAAIAHVTSSCPEVAPAGWRLYVAYAVPVPALGAFDREAEIALTMTELRDQLSGFDQAQVLRVRMVSGEWPAQRAAAGLEASMRTPLPNVINVGDGVRMYGDGGTQACAVTGELAAARLLATGTVAPAWRRASPDVSVSGTSLARRVGAGEDVHRHGQGGERGQGEREKWPVPH